MCFTPGLAISDVIYETVPTDRQMFSFFCFSLERAATRSLLVLFACGDTLLPPTIDLYNPFQVIWSP